MYRNLCLVTFCLLALVSCIHCKVPSSSFAKKDNFYQSVYGNIPYPPSPGYYEILKDLVTQYKQSKITYTELNKFGPALDQLFLFKYLQKLYGDLVSSRTANSNSFPDVLFVPEYIDSQTGLQFKDVYLYNFPATKRGPKPAFKHEPFNSASQFQVKNQYNSDNIILTGSVYIDGTNYFIVYRLVQPIYEVEFYFKRDLEDAFFAKQSLFYNNEDFISTYDSSYSNSSEINAILKKSVTNNVVPNLLSNLSSSINEDLEHQVVKSELEFVQTYIKGLLIAIGGAGVEFVKGVALANNGSDIFKSSDIVFKSDSKTAPIQYQQDTKNIIFKGFLNYETSELVYDNTSLSGGGQFYNMSQGIQFTYPKDGEKQAIVSFDYLSGRRYLHREFNVKSITIISEYLSDLKEKQLNVYRNKDVFFNKAGFLVRFEWHENVDEVYYFVFNHIGNDIARAIQTVVESLTPTSRFGDSASPASTGAESGSPASTGSENASPASTGAESASPASTGAESASTSGPVAETTISAPTGPESSSPPPSDAA